MTTPLRDVQVRVRFAPSPTGHLHIGGLRTALFNWLFARHTKGLFFLRIEDTDLERSKPEFLASILTALDWTSLHSDEPHVIQTHSIELHKKLIQKLLNEGKAYKCYCPPAYDSESMNYSQYGSLCRDVTPRNDEQSFVVRLKIPRQQERIEFNDLIRGPVSFPLDQFDDFIIARSDGTPVYNFVVVADDVTMKITHVIRGEDHISNTPKQIFIYHALGYSLPEFAHIPLILGTTGARLSKRDAATSVLDYRSNGYLPQALCNYLVRLGWSHGDQEIFSLDELIRSFSLENVGKKGAIFDQKKLDWVNSVYIKQMGSQELLDIILKDIDKDLARDLLKWTHEQLLGFIGLYKDRSSTLLEIVSYLRTLYYNDKAISAELQQEWFKESTLSTLHNVLNMIKDSDEFNVDFLKKNLKELAQKNKSAFSDIAHPIRLALTSITSSPGIYELIILLGKDETVNRLESCIKIITDSLSK